MSGEPIPYWSWWSLILVVVISAVVSGVIVWLDDRSYDRWLAKHPPCPTCRGTGLAPSAEDTDG